MFIPEMPRITLRLDERHVDLLDEREAEDGTNRSAAARAILDEYEERMNSSHERYEDVHTSEYEVLTQRVNEVEERLAALEGASGGATPSASAGRPSTDETAPPLEDVGSTGEEPNAVSDRESAETSDDSRGEDDEGEWLAEQRDDNLRDDLETWLADHPPNTDHGKRAVLSVVDVLREESPLKTAALQERVNDEVGEHYSDARTMWNSISRYLEAVPGIEKPGYGEWGWAGDDVARDELAG